MHGIGSWAFLQTVDFSSDYVIVHGGYVDDTTNNRTEMMAVLNAINTLDGALEIYSDSGYVVKGYNNPSYLDKWVSNNWKTSTKKPVLNQDLWQKFLEIKWNKVFHLNLIKGHKKDSNPIHAYWNDICDQICTHIMQTKQTGKFKYYLSDGRIEHYVN